MNAMPDVLSWGDTHWNGAKAVAGHDGRQGAEVRNCSREPGGNYISFPEGVPSLEDFTLQTWIKAPDGGYGGWCSAQEMTPKEALLPFESYTPEQRSRAAVLCANIPLFEGPRPGFMVTLAQPRNYASVYFMAEGQPQPIVLWNLRNLQDGRWHHLAVSVARAGKLQVTIDGELAQEADISPWAGAPLGGGPLSIGADGQGAYGLFRGILSGFSILPGIPKAAALRSEYYRGAVGVLAEEIAARRLVECPLYSPEGAKALLAKAEAAREAAQQGDAEKIYNSLRQEYEAFLQNTVKSADAQFLLISDAHCEGEDGGRTKALRRGLRWARSLGMEAVLDGGDYSAYGKDYELDSYWNAMNEEWPDKPLFVSLGNHETLEMKSRELVAYHCGKLARRGMVSPHHNKFYYEGEVAGCHVIVLAQYSDTYTVTGYKGLWAKAGEIKQEQLDFLNERLDRYCGQGKPVFLVIHNTLKPLMDKRTGGRSPEDMVIIKGDGLYEALKGRRDVVICTGHVHNGFGGGAGCYKMEDGYHAIDVVGFRCNTFGYGISVNDTPGPHHCGYFVYLFGKTLLLRAADLAAEEWLPVYDQLIELDG